MPLLAASLRSILNVQHPHYFALIIVHFRLNTHSELYGALRQVIAHGDKFATNDIDNHVAGLFLFDFEQSGIHLSEPERQRVVALNDAILHLGQHFVNGSASPRYVNSSLIPDNLKYL